MTAPSDVHSLIIPLLADLVEEWELDGWEDEVGPETQLIADLGLTSVDFVDLFVAIEKELSRSIGFHDLLMVDGKYVSDLSLGELTQFTERRLATDSAEEAQPPATSLAESRGEAVTRTSRVTPETVRRFEDIVPPPPVLTSLPRKNRSAAFLLSAPRSGSTLLQVILAGHPGVFAPPELHLLWFEDFVQRRGVYSRNNNKHLLSGTIRALMEVESLTIERATELMERLEAEGMTTNEFYGLLQSRLNGRLLVDKTPSYAYRSEVLERAEAEFEEPLFVHLVRHPGGMTRSFLDARLQRTVPFMMRHETEFTPEDLAELAWLTSNRNILEFLRGVPPHRHHLVHFEDLVKEPEATVSRLCEFLGLEFREEMLDPYRDKRARMADGLLNPSEMSGDLKFHLFSRIEPDAAGRWRRFMSEDAMGEVTWELASVFGYVREGSPAGG